MRKYQGFNNTKNKYFQINKIGLLLFLIIINFLFSGFLVYKISSLNQENLHWRETQIDFDVGVKEFIIQSETNNIDSQETNKVNET